MKTFTERLNENEHAPLRSVKITFEDGDTVSTNMAAHLSDEEIHDYYKVGKKFNLGFRYIKGEEVEDNLQAVTSVEILS